METHLSISPDIKWPIVATNFQTTPVVSEIARVSFDTANNIVS